MKTADFDFHLPQDLIASRPAEKRDHSRLLVLHRDGGIEHRRFFEIGEYLHEGDMLVLNNTKVVPARIIGKKTSGGKVDLLLLRRAGGDGTWEILMRGRYEGRVIIGDEIEGEIGTESDSLRGGVGGGGSRKKFLRVLSTRDSSREEALLRYGSMPLPPYIKRFPDNQDRERYQTVYAEKEGSIAAPTAGLHFTSELVEAIRDKGVQVRMVTLHVGPGTFKPIESVTLEGHRMEAEFFEVDPGLTEEIHRVRASGKKVVAVGTTTTRTVEGIMSGVYQRTASGCGLEGTEGDRLANLQEGVSPLACHRNDSIRGLTDIFIYPGYTFKGVNGLVTNFHLPRSTPLMLVSAFSTFEKVARAYKEAISEGYRFFSYGDAMLSL